MRLDSILTQEVWWLTWCPPPKAASLMVWQGNTYCHHCNLRVVFIAPLTAVKKFAQPQQPDKHALPTGQR